MKKQKQNATAQMKNEITEFLNMKLGDDEPVVESGNSPTSIVVAREGN